MVPALYDTLIYERSKQDAVTIVQRNITGYRNTSDYSE